MNILLCNSQFIINISNEKKYIKLIYILIKKQITNKQIKLRKSYQVKKEIPISNVLISKLQNRFNILWNDKEEEESKGNQLHENGSIEFEKSMMNEVL